jgi:hypothetical protein
MEVRPLPDAIHANRLGWIALLKCDEFPTAFGLRHPRRVIAREEGALEQLDADDGEHELKNDDQNDQAIGSD